MRVHKRLLADATQATPLGDGGSTMLHLTIDSIIKKQGSVERASWGVHEPHSMG